MATRTIPITEFKAHLLQLASEVDATRDEIMVTRHGKPILRVSPVERPVDLRGSLVLPDDISELFTADGEWPDPTVTDPVAGTEGARRLKAPLALP